MRKTRVREKGKTRKTEFSARLNIAFFPYPNMKNIDVLRFLFTLERQMHTKIYNYELNKSIFTRLFPPFQFILTRLDQMFMQIMMKK